MPTANSHLPRDIYTVSSLTENIKRLLEDRFSILWISGEISNLRIPASGHAYFTLRDEKAQIAAVVFKGQRRQLGFGLENGTTIVGMGRITVYEPRGSYQIILEYVEPRGLGALQLAFEQRKRKLDQEGLFDPARKRPLPALPAKIGVITSPSGAVIRDIINIGRRRFPNMAMVVLPVRVQGETAPAEIVKALDIAGNRQLNLDLVILARGGGSLEDLAAFNEEAVARAVYHCRIPVVSAIGHETDFTIADFVADVRAPTPSAAAEIAIPVKAELKADCQALQSRCLRAVQARVRHLDQRYRAVQERVLRPHKAIQMHLLALDDHEQRMHAAMRRLLSSLRMHYENQKKHLFRLNIKDYFNTSKAKNDISLYKLTKIMTDMINMQKTRLARNASALRALDPMAVLRRGYSITRTLPGHAVVMQAQSTSVGQSLEVLLAEGALEVTVAKKKIGPR